MPTGWFVCLSARGVGAGVGRLPVRVVVGAPGAWWAWPGAGVRVGVYVARVAGGLRAVGTVVLAVSGVGGVKCGGVAGVVRGGWW